MKSYMISKSELKFSSISCSQNKTAEMQCLLRSFTDLDCASDQEQMVFLELGLIEREEKHKFPKDNQVFL